METRTNTSNSTLVFSEISKEKTMCIAAATYRAVKKFMSERGQQNNPDSDRKEESYADRKGASGT